MITALIVLEAAAIASSLSMDAFVASFAYGSNKIKIPFLSVQVVNIICCSILGISLFIGTIIRHYLPKWLTVAICFAVLFVLGLIKLLDGVAKSIIRRYNSLDKEIKFSMFSVNFILRLYADPVEADVDESKMISPVEAASLAVALSLDGMAVGFGAALGDINGVAIVLASLVTNSLAVMLGCCLGNKIAGKTSFNLSWLGGVILIGLAVMKLF